MSEIDSTPLMRQYQEIKADYQDAILFFRVGDFYEMFLDDAKEASAILDIVLTSRGKNKDTPIPLCGVPHHAAMGYISKLLKAGKTVALCEQVEDPKVTKGLVRRKVVRLYTPGTLFDSELLSSNEASFLASIACQDPSAQNSLDPSVHWGLATLDLSTGEFWVTEYVAPGEQIALIDELLRLEPREIIFPEFLPSEVHESLKGLRLSRLVSQDSAAFKGRNNQKLLTNHFHVEHLADLGLEGISRGLEAVGNLLCYLQSTQPGIDHQHIQKPRLRSSQKEMSLDGVTIRNLELIRPISQDRNAPTLCSVLDKSVTAMGGRLFRQWVLRPLTDLTEIHARSSVIEEAVNNHHIRNEFRKALRDIQDLQRLNSRITMEVATPRDIIGLHKSLSSLPSICSLLALLKNERTHKLLLEWDSLEDLKSLIDETVDTDISTSSGYEGFIRDGYHKELDDLRKISREGLRWIAELESREKTRTGIESLKVKFNRVFGYYIEVTKTHLSKIPGEYLRKQTLVNAERFTTEELTTLESQIIGADQKTKNLESELFEELRKKIAQSSTRIQQTAGIIAQFDVLMGLAEAAAVNRYVMPDIDEGSVISISEGRHPVIEHSKLANGFIPNDTSLDFDQHRVLLITGPNMAGKSTYLRQVALIVLMGQIGSFVPAKSARIGLVDRIFTRIGASDDLTSGKSTFMVEMAETSKILSEATPRSLILLDEVGRGTSTYDGLSIAWALAEYIQDRWQMGARTLFATHYHEMTRLEETREGIKNYTVQIKEKGQDLLFLRKIIRGRADRSYGIHVAKLAGLPTSIIERAKNILAQLETENPYALQQVEIQQSLTDKDGPMPHPILEEVKQMDLFGMTPLQALNQLADFKRRLETE